MGSEKTKTSSRATVTKKRAHVSVLAKSKRVKTVQTKMQDKVRAPARIPVPQQPTPKVKGKESDRVFLAYVEAQRAKGVKTKCGHPFHPCSALYCAQVGFPGRKPKGRAA